MILGLDLPLLRLVQPVCAALHVELQSNGC